MVANLTYRTDDITRWGSGAGSDLAAVTIDLNFWILWDALNTLERNPATGRGIDFISMVSGNQLFVHLTDHTVLGPFTVPTAIWNPRGNWFSGITYAPLDVVSENGALYLINVPHTSAGTFNPNANDGLGHQLYTLLLEQPQNEIPTGGTIGQRLVKASGSPFAMQWDSDRIRLALFIGGQPDDGELVLQYPITDNMTIPAGFAGSVAYAAVDSSAPAVFQVNIDGAAIGTITFHGSPHATAQLSADVHCVPGNVLTITAPSPQDATLANISLNLVANLTQ